MICLLLQEPRWLHNEAGDAADNQEAHGKAGEYKKDVNVPYQMCIFSEKDENICPQVFFLSTCGLNPNQYGNFKTG